ncbi:MAG: succinate dehydrogenase assembly factor 2 [Caulobacteraceae bacterium]|nr:succinate dehydrogenase assembly factor 2 [Caulobacteraceae bacterium]
MEQPDQDIYAWIVDRAPTPSEFDGEIMRLIKAFKNEAYKSVGPSHGG